MEVLFPIVRRAETEADRLSRRRKAVIDFPITELMDEDACYAKRLRWFHPDGLDGLRCHRADRLPVCGVVGRESGHVRLTVTERSDGATLERVAMRATWPMVTVKTDEWRG